METSDYLVEIVPDGFELVLELYHEVDEFIHGLVVIFHNYWLAEDGFTRILAKGLTGGLTAKRLGGMMFFPAHADGNPFCAGLLFLFHNLLLHFWIEVVGSRDRMRSCATLDRATSVHLAGGRG